MYKEIIQAMAVGDFLFLKPFLDLSFEGVIRWKLPASEIFLQFAKHKVHRSQVDAVQWLGTLPITRSPAGQWWCEQYSA
jgi:hypothetical protein